MFCSQDVNAAMFHELIGPADPFNRRFDAGIIEMIDDRGTESMLDGVVLKGKHYRTGFCQSVDAGQVEWLDPAWINQCNGVAYFSERCGGSLCHLKHVAESKNGNVGAL